MRKLFAAGAVALAMSLGACQTLDNAASKLGQQCQALQLAVLAVQVGAPEKVRLKAAEAVMVISAVCATPPTDTVSALGAVRRALLALQEARK